MKISKKEQGFGTIEALLILVIVSLVCFTSWYIWNRNNQANPRTPDTTFTSQKYLRIKEWEVRMKSDPIFNNLSYIYTAPVDPNYDVSVASLTSVLPAKYKKCRTDNWTIYRLGPNVTSPLPVEAEHGTKIKDSQFMNDPDWKNMIKKVGSFYYRNQRSNPCLAYDQYGQVDEAAASIGQPIYDAYYSMFQSLQTIPK